MENELFQLSNFSSTQVPTLTADEAKAKRATLRTAITKAETAVRVGSYRRGHLQQITLEKVFDWTDQLINLDGVINDGDSEKYIVALEHMVQKINKDEEELALRNREQMKHDIEEAKLESERVRAAAEAELTLAKVETEKAREKSFSETSISSTKQKGIRLDLKIPPFDGSPCHYRRFEELFETLVEQNPSFENAAKYLQFISLIGQRWADEFASNLPPTLESLSTVKARMRQHFEDPSKVRESVRVTYSRLPTMTHPSQTDLLRKLIIAWEEGLIALRKTDTTEDQINNTYVRLMTKHLPAVTISTCGFQRNWTVDQLIVCLKDVLEKQLLVNEYASENTFRNPTTSVKPQSKFANPRMQMNVMHNRPPAGHTFPKSIHRSDKCVFCCGDHKSIYCTTSDVNKCREVVQAQNLCVRCLSPGHHVLDCQSKYVCPCGGHHSKVLCSKRTQQQAQIRNFQQLTLEDNHASTSQPAISNESSVNTNIVSMCESTINNNTSNVSDGAPVLKYSRPELLQTYFQTVVVSINGQHVRVLLDSGGGRSVILESCAKRLKLPTYATHSMTFGGMGGDGQSKSTRLVSAELKSVINSNSLQVVLPVIPSLGGLRPATIPPEFYQQLCEDGIMVTDTPDYSNHPVEMIIGLEYIGKIWLNMERPITDDLCIRESIFGWTVFGVTIKLGSSSSYSPLLMMHSSFEDIPKEYASTSELTRIEKQYLEEFIDTKVKLKGNEYYVKLPWLTPINLGSNMKQASDRFHRLMKSLTLKERLIPYSAAMAETINKFAEPAPLKPTSPNVYYLPHHLVLRLDKATTQHRVVFDGSASEKGFQPLNDCVFKGVNSWNSLDLLITFRFGQYAVTADIEKAFLQIKVEEEDRDALRFWWIDSAGVPTVYRFTSVPFGTSTSPFLLYAVMQKILQQAINSNDPNMSTIARIIADRFYVDDLVAALQTATIAQVNNIKTTTETIFKGASMNVRKWRTNVKELDQLWSPDAPASIDILGHSFNTVNDTLSLSVDLPSHFQHSVLTKRLFSSLLSRLYDPMGLISPYIVHLRLILRKFWSQGLDWDDPAPDELRKEALAAVQDAHLVNTVALSRNILSADDSPTSLLVFCDASKLAIGAVAYTLVNNVPTLLHSRSKLAKVVDEKKQKKDKETTIAEGELNALVMGAEIASYLSNLPVVKLNADGSQQKSTSAFSEIIICSDSLLNLQRLIKHPNDQRSSISLRINQMKGLVPTAVYRHSPGKQNPADLISRGCTMTNLLANQLWFNPTPPDKFTRFDESITTSIATFVPAESTCRCHRFRTYGEAIRVWRRVARFLHNASPTYRKDLQDSESGSILLIKYVQHQHFSADIVALTEKRLVDRNSVLRGYKCFLDEDGILRLRTRLHSGANLTENQVKPIIIPAKCHLSELITLFEHQRIGHAGKDRTMHAVRDQFFMFGLRRSVSKLINTCNVCKRLRGKPLSADFGNIPRFRYAMKCTPFTNVGIDIFGPLKVAMTTKGKRYGVIFSCATTRAIHLELIHDQTASEVHRAMTNFISRRGIPHLIYTDNGTNLLSVKKQFVRLLEQLTGQFPSHDYRVKWIQLTASSPWRGGFYERLIKTVKDTLIALTFGRVIDNETLTSALYMVEGRLNSRPLFLHNGEVITPSHFFANRPLMQLPPIGTKTYRELSKTPLVQQYKASQAHVNSVWNAWYNQYLLQLKSFHANLFLPNQSDNLRVGDAVILKNPTPPEQWPFGVVTEVIKSEDGTIRTVRVRTHDRGNIVIKARDVRTLIPFECTQEIHADEDSGELVESLLPTP